MRVGAPHIVAAVLVIVLVLVVVVFSTPMFDKLKESMGFGTELSAEEMQTQIKATEIFVDEVYPTLDNCAKSRNVSCFCTDEKFEFPTDYTLSIYDKEGMKIALSNHLGGEVESRLLFDIKPCVGWKVGFDLSGFGYVQDDKVTLRYSYTPAPLIEFFDLGEDKFISKPFDLSYVFYKPRAGHICVLTEEYASAKRVVGGGICE